MPTLDLTDLEARVLVDALNAYTHMHLGSFATAADKVLMRSENLDRLHDTRELLETAQERFTGTRHGGPSIGNPRVSNDARVARLLEARLTGDTAAVRLYEPNGSVTAFKADPSA